MIDRFKYGNKFTTIFLFDALPPTKMLLMQRGPARDIFPNAWTGPGGKIDDGETQSENAPRELGEETSPSLTPELTEFARLIINGDRVVCYFTGVTPFGEPPTSNEGTLHWVPLAEVLEREVVPTTLIVLRQWSARGWSPEPFTVKCTRKPGDLNAPAENVTVSPGLVW